MKLTTISRGAAAALLTIGLAAPLAAQAAGGGGRSAIRRGDSVIVRTLGTGKIDTITMLVRELGNEQYGSTAWLALTRKLDSLVLTGTPARLMFRATANAGHMSGPVEFMPRGWAGFNAQGPSNHIIDSTGYRVTYFAYPAILSVDPESPADRAGIVPGDVLVAFNGADVVGREFNLTRLFVPEKKVGVTIRRDGETKDYSLDIVKAPEGVANRRMEFSRVPMAGGGSGGTMHIQVDKNAVVERMDVMRRTTGGAPRAVVMSGPLMAGKFMVISSNAVWGATVSAVSTDLARVLRIERGMLVNEVPEQSPAFKAGLRAGDVITMVAGQPVTNHDELQNQVVSRLGDRAVALQVMRDHKPVRINVTW